MVNPNSDSVRRDRKQERREARRAATLRRALFLASNEGVAPTRGTVVEVSTGGMRIHTQAPERVGQQIEVELYPKGEERDGESILVRGRVLHVSETGAGVWAMGVRLAVVLPKPGAGAAPRIQDAEEAREAAGVVSQQIRGLANGQPSPLAYLESLEPGREYPATVRPVAPADVPRRKTRYALRVLLAMVLLVAALFFLGFGDKYLSTVHEVLGYLGSGMQGRVAPEGPPAAQDHGRSMLLPSADVHLAVLARPPRKRGHTPEQLLSRAQAALAAGDAAAIGLFRAVPLHAAVSPLERFIGLLGQSQATAGLGKRERARALLAKALEAPGAVPEPWIALAGELRESLGKGGPEAPRMPTLSAALELDTAPALTPEEKGTLRIEVVKSQYLLTVFRGEEQLGPFPVGLGRGDMTPEGAFVIANKLDNPDWYNRGTIVKAGDPANPLGAWWMGLGDKRGPTPYGIHPTNEPESIGGDMSRGCIRMCPDDATLVFEACAIGTPVYICP